MRQTYDPKQELLAQLTAVLEKELTPAQLARFGSLPEPCRNHLEERLRKPERAQKLSVGCQRLASYRPELFLEGLRLFPHALCRVAETIGPISKKLWNALMAKLEGHRLWQVSDQLEAHSLDQETFWNSIESLAPHRELPQSVLDFLEEKRPKSQAPWPDFLISVNRFLVRARLEKLRFETYSALRAGDSACSEASSP